MNVILCSLLLLQFAQGAQTQLRDLKLPGGHVIKSVEARVTEEGGEKILNVDYRTTVSVRDCSKLQTEVRNLFIEYLKPEAERVGATAVDIWPKDASGIAHDFYYVRQEDATWKEEFGFRKCK